MRSSLLQVYGLKDILPAFVTLLYLPSGESLFTRPYRLISSLLIVVAKTPDMRH